MHGYHDNGLYKKRKVVTCSRPIEYLEDRCCEHNQGDVEGEASRGASTVDGEDLVSIRSQWREDKAKWLRIS